MNQHQRDAEKLAYLNYQLQGQVSNLEGIIMNVCQQLDIKPDPSGGIPVESIFKVLTELKANDNTDQENA